MSALGGTFTYTFGGTERQLGLLTVEDLVTLTASIPATVDDIIDLQRLYKWAGHPVGCEHVLTLAAKKVDPTVTQDKVKTWGSIRQRSVVAVDLFTKSCVSGEEPEAPKAQADSGTTGG